MAFPTEFNDSSQVIGSTTNLKHPVYSFRVILNRNTQENVGPITNNRKTTLLHPDQHTESADAGRSNAANHATQISSLIPGLNLSNIISKDDGTFIASGEHALHLKKNYVDVENPLLAITNSAPYTSA